MSTSGRQVDPDRPTRQQLDELDALMERMLALPVNQPEELVAPSTEIPDARMGEPSRDTSLTSSNTAGELKPQGQRSPAGLPGSSVIIATTGLPAPRIERQFGPHPEDHPRSCLAPESIQAPGTAGQESDARAQAAAPLPKASGTQDRPGVETGPAVGKPARPLWIRPVVWCNDTYDASTWWTGPMGRWLRSPGGRTVLGFAGILLLAGALIWVAMDSWGWTW